LCAEVDDKLRRGGSGELGLPGAAQAPMQEVRP